MKYKPADNMTSDFPETYEIYIGLSQCCDNTNCWYYGGPGLRNMFALIKMKGNSGLKSWVEKFGNQKFRLGTSKK